MPRTPGLQRRKHGYYFRMKVPADLRGHFGKHEIVRSLKTRDFQEARRLVSIERARAEVQFDQIRRQRPINSDRPSTIVDVEQAIWDWFSKQDRKEWDAFERATDDEVDTVVENLKTDEAHLTNLRDEQGKAAIKKVADEIVRDYRLNVGENDELFAEICARVRRGLIEHVRRWQDWLAGDLSRNSHDPDFASPPAAPGSEMSVDQMINAFLNDPSRSKRSPKKALEYGLAFVILREIVGANESAVEITRDHCRRMRDLLCRLPTNSTKRYPGLTLIETAQRADRDDLRRISPTTINGYLTKIGTLFRWAVRERYMDDNPAEGLQVSIKGVRKNELRKPFSEDQLKLIFSAPLYTGCLNDAAGYAISGPKIVRGTRFWVPLIALYSGLRLNEICQLHTSDVITINKIKCINVNDDTESTDNPKRLKSAAAKRIVPVHNELLNIGLENYFERSNRRGNERLFPDLRRDTRGYYSDALQKWFSRFLDKSKAKRERTSFHSFRHNFRDALRRAGISEEMARELGGWADQSTSSIYGQGFDIASKNEAMQMVEYPILDHSSLYQL